MIKTFKKKPALNFEKLLPFVKLFIKRKKKKRWILALYLRTDKLDGVGFVEYNKQALP